MPEGLGQLRDIHGLDGLPWWPLAPGWWLLITALLVLAAMVLAWRHWLWLPGGGWKADALRRLRSVRSRLGRDDVRALAGELSELVRRIAMARFGRKSCAGLVGEQWLSWLQANDPNDFAWTSLGTALIDLPYAPPRVRGQATALVAILEAAEGWVRADPPSLRRWPGSSKATAVPVGLKPAGEQGTAGV